MRPGLRRARHLVAATRWWLAVTCSYPGLLLAEEEEPVSLTGEYSAYEREAIDAAARDLGTEVEPEPEGKLVERVAIVTLDPVEERDAPPRFLNALHATTRRTVVERNLLVKTGDLYRKILVDESARILRRAPQLSVVLCVPLRGTRSDRVVLLVITKDVWSLFLDFDFQLAQSGYDYVLLEPKETNLFGTHQTVSGRLYLQPLSYSLGGTYQEPRLGGSWIGALADGNAIVNKQTGRSEGSYGTLQITRPLASSMDRWSWFTDVSWRSEITRHYSNGKLVMNGSEPDQYLTRKGHLQGAVTRSFGWANKNDFTLLFTMSRNAYRLTQEPPDSAPSAVRVPTSDTRVGPALEWHAYSSDYLRTLDYDTLALQEDHRLRHDIVLRAYPVLRAFGSTRDLLGIYAAAQFTAPLASGFVRAAVEGTNEWDLGNAPDVPADCSQSCRISDGNVAAHLTIAGPRSPVGRLIFGAHAVNRYRNHLNSTSYLGSDSTLRGYPTSFFRGDDIVTLNIELRSRPIELLSTHWAAAAFYDAGDAFDCFERERCANAFELRSDAGVGLRFVWPEIDRTVFRADFAVPFNRFPTPSGFVPDPWQISFAFGQAFGTETITATKPVEGEDDLEEN